MTFEELRDLFRAHTRDLIPGADTSDGSHYDLLCRMLAATFQGNQAQAAYLLAQAFPATAELDHLTEWATRLLIDRMPATKSTALRFRISVM